MNARIVSQPTSLPSPGGVWAIDTLIERLKGGGVFIVRLIDAKAVVAVTLERYCSTVEACGYQSDPLLTIDQVMADLKIGRTFFYGLVRERKIIAVKMENETRVFGSVLTAYKASLPQLPSKSAS